MELGRGTFLAGAHPGRRNCAGGRLGTIESAEAGECGAGAREGEAESVEQRNGRRGSVEQGLGREKRKVGSGGTVGGGVWNRG